MFFFKSISRALKQEADIRSVITRFEDTRVYQIFVQDGKRIDIPVPEWNGLPKEAGLTADICNKTVKVFEERDRFAEGGGWKAHREVLSRPMVLSLSINTDVSDGTLFRSTTNINLALVPQPLARRRLSPRATCWIARSRSRGLSA